MKKYFGIAAILFFLFSCNRFIAEGVRKNDLQKDVLIETNFGNIVMRLSDSTPLHRNNMIKLVNAHYYDSILFHRVIPRFVIQAGDANSKHADMSDTTLGDDRLKYTVPVEIIPSLYHVYGAVGAAREGDDTNPTKASSSSQFYIVIGKTFTNTQLDSVEIKRLQGRKISAERRAIYSTTGGTPQLDGNYTVYGMVVSGMDVVVKITEQKTTGRPNDRPLQPVRILKMKMVERKPM
jgi:cyclophilin family peptidyl-prolyl cis-trans isomerase